MQGREFRMSRRILRLLAASLFVAASVLVTVTGWVQAQDPSPRKAGQAKDESAKSDDPTAPARNRMVQRHLVERGIKNPRVLEAFRTVPRHRFLPPGSRR